MTVCWNALCYDAAFWDLFWAWTRDGDVWDWVRTVTAALFGALAGGWFTLRGQSKANAASQMQQARQFAAETEVATERWERERHASARLMSIETARALLDKLAGLQTAVRSAPITKKQAIEGHQWDEWALIWNDEVESELERLAELVVDDGTRSVLLRVISMLDGAENLTAGWNPERVKPDIKSLTLQLISDAIGVTSSYIRDDVPNAEREEFLVALEKSWDHYVEYEEWSMAQSLKFYEEFTTEEKRKAAMEVHLDENGKPVPE